MICCRCFAEACCQDTISFGFVTGHLKENLGFATKRRYRPFDKWLFSSADHYVQLPRLSYKEWKTQSIQKWSKKDPKWKRIFSQIVMVSYSSLIYYSSRFVSLLLIFYVLSVVRRLHYESFERLPLKNSYFVFRATKRCDKLVKMCRAVKIMNEKDKILIGIQVGFEPTTIVK